MNQFAVICDICKQEAVANSQAIIKYIKTQRKYVFKHKDKRLCEENIKHQQIIKKLIQDVE